MGCRFPFGMERRYFTGVLTFRHRGLSGLRLRVGVVSVVGAGSSAAGVVLVVGAGSRAAGVVSVGGAVVVVVVRGRVGRLQMKNGKVCFTP